MRQPLIVTTVGILALVMTVTRPSQAGAPNPKQFDPPPPTAWRPQGCRSVPADNPVLGSHDRWRLLHSDVVNSDEVSIALAPSFDAGWTAETGTFHVTVPTFDRAGNLYVAPFLPYENVAMFSLDPNDGSRRWSIPGTGAPSGAVAPMVLEDPANPGQEIVYLTLYDRAVAVRTDGSVVWDVPTGLTLTGVLRHDSVPGNSYLPSLDAIVGLTADGHIYLLSRTTGAQLLAEPYSLPGEQSPPGLTLALPPDVVANVESQLRSLINFPPGSTLQSFLAAVLGNEIEVSNSFSIDPHTSRMWVAATAPDAADGAIDGVSELGALYGLDVVPSGSGWAITIACSRTFTGGSASTPSLRSDGTRNYFGDNLGTLFALDASCNEVWSLGMGSQIVGSVGVASDNNELYVATQTNVVQVIDEGSSARVGWTADLGVYFPGAPNQANFNLLLASVGANGVGFMAGAGIPPGALASIGLPFAAGYGVLDRATGSVRYFADGLDESVAELNAGPDGAYYNANSPVRRAFARALFPTLTPPIEGGIRKFAPKDLDLLVRDAVCAARDRARNAAANQGSCPDSAAADVAQIADLIAQARRTAPRAIARGDLSAAKWARIETGLTAATGALAIPGGADLAAAGSALAASCTLSVPCPTAPLDQGVCGTSRRSTLMLRRKPGKSPNDDRLTWIWGDGEPTAPADFADPSATADYALCVYAGAPGAETLVYESAVPASSERWRGRTNGFTYSDPTRAERGLRRTLLRASALARSLIAVKAAGTELPPAQFPLGAPATVQLVNLSSGACWESRFDQSAVNASDRTLFKAKFSR